MPRVIHFEINADEPQRAVKFYEKAFAWKISQWEGPMEYWLIRTGEEGEPGIDGAIMKREQQWSTIITIEVPSYEEFARKVEEAGGKIVTAKQAIPGVGCHSYCLDTEGNIFGVLEPDR